MLTTLIRESSQALGYFILLGYQQEYTMRPIAFHCGSSRRWDWSSGWGYCVMASFGSRKLGSTASERGGLTIAVRRTTKIDGRSQPRNTQRAAVSPGGILS